MHSKQAQLLRKRILIRSNRRGCKEGDLILGSFIAKCINDFAVEELYFIEQLLQEADLHIIEWIIAPESAPQKWQQHGLIKRIHEYARSII